MEIAVPSTYTADERNLMVRTYKIGELARAASIFGVEKIWVYYDDDPLFNSMWLGELIRDVLHYAVLPPHLKKYFPKKKRMKYAGIVSPLQIPSHIGKKDRPDYVMGRAKGNSTVEVGIHTFKTDAKLKKEFVNLKVDWDSMKGEPVERSQIPHYWGYEVELFEKELPELVDKLAHLRRIIGTSRRGSLFFEVRNQVRRALSGDCLIVFGSAYRGIYDLLDDEHLEKLNPIVNTVPKQRTDTVRTIEGVFATLSLFNELLAEPEN